MPLPIDMPFCLPGAENGKYPVVCDTSPCLAQIKSSLSSGALRQARAASPPSFAAPIRCLAEPLMPFHLLAHRFSLYEPVEFIRHFLAKELEFSKVRDSIAVHVPCSSKKMGIEESFMQASAAAAEQLALARLPTLLPAASDLHRSGSAAHRQVSQHLLCQSPLRWPPCAPTTSSTPTSHAAAWLATAACGIRS